MKICIVIPSERYLNNAGARIRYQRLRAPLVEAGHKVSVSTIEAFRKLDHDVYLFSKCYEATSLIIARRAAQAGKIVGVDLFDDYFSQYDNGQTQRFRSWLQEFVPNADFVLCSTPAFIDIVRDYDPKLPVHIMGDSFDSFDIEKLKRLLNAKHSDLWATKTLRVAWYGRGDNALFPVGLADLAAFGSHLSALQDYGFAVRLEVMTNSEAMTGDALASLAAVPVPFEVHEWSEADEQALLERSHVVFLPVSGQSFSIAKSLNRCTTAFSSGCQVLSVGYPLYEVFDSVIYRDARTLGDDLACKQPRLRLETLERLQRLLHLHADPVAGANNLIAFLETLAPSTTTESQEPQEPQQAAPVILLNGIASTGLIHKFVRRQKGLSVASPFTVTNVNYDVRFEWNAACTGLDVLLSENARGHLAEPFMPMAVEHGMINEFPFYKIAQESLPELSLDVAFLAKSASPSGKYAAYQDVIKVMKTVLQMLFPQSACVVAELSKAAHRAAVDNPVGPLELQ
ncbi:hypothetical protein [Rhizobium sp. Leaf341]|uniref:hypothetical protein n=1 Tax=Rhizobium sp. Leaf341 TaxID=1736344 RepID=UPI000713DCB2|nr:hypothetical protein [Rhizobium sp. Leaf341]KQR69185.1 hypothetical protein ASG03_08280 [Rhizobium sp. Leaf341]